jgi:DNA-directed RNA polymerase subunit beta'
MKSNIEVLELKKILGKLENLHSSFDYLRIRIASPERIKSWAERVLPNGEIVGEVLRSETINFRSHQPETYGLFCEKIFGPLKNWKCKCGKYNGFILDKICEECHVEIIEARVRRYRMGYIDLTCPISHFWYLKGIPSYLTTILSLVEPNIKLSHVENIVYFREKSVEEENFFSIFSRDFSENVVKEITDNQSTIKKGENNIFNSSFSSNEVDSSKTMTNELTSFLKNSSRSRRDYSGKKFFQKRDGAELLKAVLESIDIKYEINKARSLLELENSNLNENSKTLIRKIRILESFFATQTNLNWMIFTVLPVLPPSLRPLLELENGRLVAADVNEIYRLIITRNQRLFDFRSLFVPDLITMQSKKLLQESVDSLIDNARVSKERKITLNNKALKSLSEILEGKQGRFRQSLLGKRVDYSGRSVIVVGPSLRLNQCGLPYQIGIIEN